MKIEVLQEELLKGLNAVLRASSLRVQLPILAFVKMEVAKDLIRLMATDLELGISIAIKAKTEGEGRIAVPGKMLAEFLGTVAPGRIEILVEEGKIRVRAAGYKAEFLTGNVEEFPQLPGFGGGVGEVEVGEMESAIAAVAFASAKEALRPALTGVLMEIGKKIKLVATDGFRLAVAMVENEKPATEQTVLVPSRAMLELSRIYETGKIEIGYLEKTKQVLFRQGEVLLVTQLIDGSFPDYQRILPKEFGTELTLARSELLSAVKTTTVFARDNSNMMRWEVTKGEIVITSQSPSRGECTATVATKTTGEPTSVVFNAKYVLDYLAIPGEENLWIGLGGKLSPGMIKEEGKTNGFYVVMPINA